MFLNLNSQKSTYYFILSSSQRIPFVIIVILLVCLLFTFICTLYIVILAYSIIALFYFYFFIHVLELFQFFPAFESLQLYIHYFRQYLSKCICIQEHVYKKNSCSGFPMWLLILFKHCYYKKNKEKKYMQSLHGYNDINQ